MYGFIYIELTGKNYDEDRRVLRLVKYDDNCNPTYCEVINFLMQDKTDFLRYIPGNFVCSDFNAIVHNNAQYAGFNCKYCFLEDFDEECGHTCLAWDTLDYGRVYTDSTGVLDPDSAYLSYDKVLFNVGNNKIIKFRDIETGTEGNLDFIMSDISLF